MTGTAFPIDASAGAPQFAGQAIRTSLAALMLGRTDRALGAVSGVRPGSEPAVTFTGLTWVATPFCGISDPGTAGNIGPYLTAFTQNETGALAAADGTNSRIDRFDVVLPDDTASDGVRTAVLKVTSGSPASQPAAAAAPARSWPVGFATVPPAGSGQSVAWQPAHVYSAASGGVLPIVDGTAYPAHPYNGQAVYRLDRDTLEVYNGTAWDAFWGGDSGVLTTGVIGLNGFTPSTVRLRRKGSRVAIYVSGTLGAGGVTVNSNGDTTNTDIAKITNAALLPGPTMFGQPLVSGTTGPVVHSMLGPDGTITVCSTGGSNLVAGSGVSFAGTYEI